MPRAAALLPLLLVASCGGSGGERLFRVHIANVAPPGAIATSGGNLDFHLPPGAYALTRGATPFFTPGASDDGRGMESLAEDGDPTAIVTTAGAEGLDVGWFEFDATYQTGAIPSGGEFVLDVVARPGDRLHLVTMLGESNDWFFSTPIEGLAFFDGNAPIDPTTVFTTQVFDLGTEVDEPLGEGPNQAPRQSAPNTGAAEGGTVARESAAAAAEAWIEVTIEEVLVP